MELAKFPCVRHAVFSGSAMHGYASPTSDLDFFLIFDQETDEISSFGTSNSRWDMEVRTMDWLLRIGDQLESRPHSILEVGYSGNFSDLRFLVRFTTGKSLLTDNRVQVEIDRIKEIVQFWGRVYLSGAYANLYEDLVGLLYANRLIEFQLRVGELALRALHLAMAREKVVDLSSKPALVWLNTESKSDSLRYRWAKLMQVIGHAAASVSCAKAALFACNGLTIEKLQSHYPAQSFRPSIGLAHDSPPISVSICFLGVPTYRVVQDVSDKVVYIYTDQFLHSYFKEIDSHITAALQDI